VKNPVLCLGVALLLSGCGGVLPEMSLAPANGAGQPAQRTPQTMTAAARATLAAGYTHFKFSEPSTAVAPLGARPDASCVWGTGCGDEAHLVSQVGLAITMFHASDPGAAGAFDAKQVLSQYNVRQ
jgi:uncharacterized protein YceK